MDRVWKPSSHLFGAKSRHQALRQGPLSGESGGIERKEAWLPFLSYIDRFGHLMIKKDIFIILDDNMTICLDTNPIQFPLHYRID